MYYRHKNTGMVYTSYKKELGNLASVTTANTPFAYIVKDSNVQKSTKPFPLSEKTYPLPKPLNVGKTFNRWGDWVTVNFTSIPEVEKIITERERVVATIPNDKTRQVEVDYIEALKVNLGELKDGRTT